MSEEIIRAALSEVEDPEIRKPITELDMVKSITLEQDRVVIEIYLTVVGCPLKQEIIDRIKAAVKKVKPLLETQVVFDVMNDDQRKKLREKLRGPQKINPFAKEDSLTKVFAIASGKGGVGKSSLTVNLAAAMAAKGFAVGILDADVYGHSIPRILGIDHAPTMVEGMIMPPAKWGVRAISMLPFKPGGVSQPIAFRGPMLHKALEQFLTDVWWGDLDFLLLDLPPGTGDVAISVAQLLPKAEIIVITTPQISASEVAVRAGTISSQTHQTVAGVIENMSEILCTSCNEPMNLFGSGGGEAVVESLNKELGKEVPLLGKVPFDVRLREGGDKGEPLVLSDPTAPASVEIIRISEQLIKQPKGLAGKPLNLSPVSN
jgi:ATP-binding protein involved in chromosome partitioning